MKITIQEGLPYVTAELTYRGRRILFENVLVDTGYTKVAQPQLVDPVPWADGLFSPSKQS